MLNIERRPGGAEPYLITNGEDTLAGQLLNDLAWRRSSFCSANGCVEVASPGEQVAVRDSHDPGAGQLIFTRGAWHRFITDIKTGRVPES
jgi:Domain of unknown function (DUF397)